ncbi:MAG: ABC transporter substrate-binding protein [Haloarculaceae archaeon]
MTDDTSRPFDRRSFLKLSGTTVTAAGLAGCRTGSQGNSDTITLGVLAPTSTNNPAGRSIVDGAKLAKDRINADGGILGKEVDLAIKDTEGKASTAKSVYQDLVLKEGATATFGVFSSEALMKLMDSFAQQEKIHMTTGAATPQSSQLVSEHYDKYKYQFRTGPFNAVQLGYSMGEFAKNAFGNMGFRKIALLIEDREWTLPIRKVLNQTFPKTPFDVVAKETYSTDIRSFSPLYDKFEQHDADVAFVAMAHGGSSQAIVQWARNQRNFAFGGVHVPDQLPSFYEQTKRAAAYTFTENIATPESTITSKTQPFVTAYKNKFEQYPVYTGYITHDAVQQYAAVAEKQGTVDSGKMVSGLEQSSYTGTYGTIEYQGKGQQYAHDVIYDPTKVSPLFQQWQPVASNPNKGTQEVIYPKDELTSKYVSPPWVR